MCFRDRNESEQRANLADLWIIFDAEMNAGMPAINESRAHCGPVHLTVDQPNAGSEFLRVIGRPPDSLAFAWSDRSGRNERRIFCFSFIRLRDFYRFRDFRKQKFIQFFS